MSDLKLNYERKVAEFLFKGFYDISSYTNADKLKIFNGVISVIKLSSI